MWARMLLQAHTMNARMSVLPVLALALSAVVGCSASVAADETSANDEELRASSLTKYGMAMGIVATGEDARSLYETIQGSDDGKVLENGRALAGLTALDAGLAKEGDEDANAAFGLTCELANPDDPASGDVCQLFAPVVMADQKEQDTVVVRGKLATAMALALPRTSPEGLVGATTYEAGSISCKAIPGPAGTTCTVKALATVASFKEMMETAEDASLTKKEAQDLVRAFFPSR